MKTFKREITKTPGLNKKLFYCESSDALADWYTKVDTLSEEVKKENIYNFLSCETVFF